MTRCGGDSPGVWVADRWVSAHPEACTWTDYVSRPLPLIGPHRSALLIGDSTDRNKLHAACARFGTRAESYVPNLHLELAHGNSGYAACALGSRVVLGQFMHYGVMDPPYFRYAYPVKPPLRNESYAHLSHDAILFRAHANGGREPTLVVLQSYAWDIAAECQRRHHSRLLQGDIADWTARVVKSVRHVRRIFPRSKLMWRTSHPFSVFCATPTLIDRMNAAVRAVLPQKEGVSILEWNWMMNASHTPPECRGALHVTEKCNVQHVNVLLNILTDRRVSSGQAHTRPSASRK